MKVVNLFGHLIIDKVFSDFEYTHTLGGIVNVWDSLLRLSNDISVNLKPCSIGEAVVVLNKNTNERVGRAILNSKSNIPIVTKADWHHIAYINQVVDTSFISKIDQGIISADITKENPARCLESLSQLDYLFISKEDLFDDVLTIGKKLKGWVIAHDPLGSLYSDGKRVYEYSIPKQLFLHKANVLGAGDSFAAAFIHECLTSKKNIHDIVAESHSKTTQLIKSK